MYDINKFLFSKTEPQKKIEVIKGLSQKELRNTSEQTIKHIIVDVGEGKCFGRDKTLMIDRKRQTGDIIVLEAVGCHNKLLEVVFRVKGQECDSVVLDYRDAIAKGGDMHCNFYCCDKDNEIHSFDFTFTAAQKAECIRTILLEYMYKHYAYRL